jgi:hypothetical protein
MILLIYVSQLAGTTGMSHHAQPISSFSSFLKPGNEPYISSFNIKSLYHGQRNFGIDMKVEIHTLLKGKGCL